MRGRVARVESRNRILMTDRSRSMQSTLAWGAWGVALLVAGSIQAYAAFDWANAWGGFVSARIGYTKLEDDGVPQNHSNQGSTTMQLRILKRCWPGIALLSVYVLLLLLIHAASQDHLKGRFPVACYGSGKEYGCSRITVTTPHNNDDLPPLQVRVPEPVAVAAVEGWLDDEARTVVLESGRDVDGEWYVHSRVATLIWGFADDFFVGLRCDAASGNLTLEVQGQLRIGKGDLGVNLQRNRNFLSAMSSKLAGDASEAGCA